jgi:HTH-type transcriptional regulator/antitoxin HigA
MIKNEKQYKITFKKLLGIADEIDRLQSQGNSLPAKERLLLVSSLTMQEQLKNEINAYIQLKTNTSPVLPERSIDSLPSLLIEFKIRSGMTQKEFSEKVGMKEQQLQRYEAEDFDSISFKNLLKILHAIGLDVTVKGNMPDVNLQKQAEDNQSIA